MASATPTFSTPNDSIAREVLVRGLWLSIPLAGMVIYRLRTRHGAAGLVPFLIGRYGRLASRNIMAGPAMP